MLRWFDRLSVAKKLFGVAGSMIVLLVAASLVSLFNSYSAQRLGRPSCGPRPTSRCGDPNRQRGLRCAHACLARARDGRRELLERGRKAARRRRDRPRLAHQGHHGSRSQGQSDGNQADAGRLPEARCRASRSPDPGQGVTDGEGRDVLDKAARAGDAIVTELKTLSQQYSDVADRTEADVIAAFALTSKITLAVSGGGVALAAALSMVIIASIRRPIRDITTTTGALASGDYSVGVPHIDEPTKSAKWRARSRC